MHDSDYVKLDRGGTYFPRSKGTFVPLQNTRQYQALLGYDATVQFDMHQGASLTSDVRPVFIENKTVNFKAKYFFINYFCSKIFLNIFSSFIENLNALSTFFEIA